MSNWQTQMTSLPNTIQYLLQSKKLYDVTFLVDAQSNQKSFKVHKFLLAIRSNVFEEMLYNTSTEKEICLPEIKANIFDIMLKYIYTEDLSVNSLKETIQTFYLAHKFNIKQLMDLCRTNLDNQLCQKNVCAVYELSIDLKDKYLRNKCEDIISKYTKEALESESFLKASQETVQNIIKQKSLDITNELYLFDIILKWAKTEVIRCGKEETSENLRNIMNPLLPYIRFLTMSLDELFQTPTTSGVLIKDEIMNIGMNISEPNSVTLPDWCNKERTIRTDFKSTNPNVKMLNTDPYLSSTVPYSTFQVHHNCLNEFDRSSFLNAIEIFSIECMMSSDRNIILNGFSFSIEYHSICKAELYMAEGNDICHPVACNKKVNKKNELGSKIYNHKMIISDPTEMKKDTWYYFKVYTEDSVNSCLCPFPTLNTLKTFDAIFTLRYINIRNNTHFHQIYYKIK